MRKELAVTPILKLCGYVGSNSATCLRNITSPTITSPCAISHCMYQGATAMVRCLTVIILYQKMRYVRNFETVTNDARKTTREIIRYLTIFIVVFVAYILIYNRLIVNYHFKDIGSMPFDFMFFVTITALSTYIVVKTRKRSSQPMRSFQNMIMVVAFINYVCLIVDIVEEIVALGHSREDFSRYEHLTLAAKWSNLLSSALNFFVYTCLSASFRKTLRKICCYCCRCRCHCCHDDDDDDYGSPHQHITSSDKERSQLTSTTSV